MYDDEEDEDDGGYELCGIEGFEHSSSKEGRRNAL